MSPNDSDITIYHPSVPNEPYWFECYLTADPNIPATIDSIVAWDDTGVVEIMVCGDPNDGHVYGAENIKSARPQRARRRVRHHSLPQDQRSWVSTSHVRRSVVGEMIVKNTAQPLHITTLARTGSYTATVASPRTCTSPRWPEGSSRRT